MRNIQNHDCKCTFTIGITAKKPTIGVIAFTIGIIVFTIVNKYARTNDNREREQTEVDSIINLRKVKPYWLIGLQTSLIHLLQ